MTQEAIMDKENFIREMKQNLKDRKEGKNAVMKNSLNVNNKEKKKYFYPKETSNFNKAILTSKLSSNKFISKQISIENLIMDSNKDKIRSEYSQNKNSKREYKYNESDYDYGNYNEYDKKNYFKNSSNFEKNNKEISLNKTNGRNNKTLNDNDDNMFHYQTSNSINKNKYLKLNTSINNSKEKNSNKLYDFKKDPLTSRNSVINSDKKNENKLKSNEYIIKSHYIKTDEKNEHSTEENFNFKYYRGKSTNVPRSLMFDKKKVFNSNRKKLYDNLQNNYNKFNQSVEKNYRISTQNSSNNNNSLNTHNTQNSMNYNSAKTNSKNIKESSNNSLNNSPTKKVNYGEISKNDCLNYSLRKSKNNKYAIITNNSNNSENDNIDKISNYNFKINMNKTRNNSFAKNDDSKQTKSYQNKLENNKIYKKDLKNSKNNKEGNNFIIETKGTMDKLIEKMDKIESISKKQSNNPNINHLNDISKINDYQNTKLIIPTNNINNNNKYINNMVNKNLILPNTNRQPNVLDQNKFTNEINNNYRDQIEYENDFKKIVSDLRKDNVNSKEKLIKRNTKTLLNSIKDTSKLTNNG